MKKGGGSDGYSETISSSDTDCADWDFCHGDSRTPVKESESDKEREEEPEPSIMNSLRFFPGPRLLTNCNSLIAMVLLYLLWFEAREIVRHDPFRADVLIIGNNELAVMADGILREGGITVAHGTTSGSGKSSFYLPGNGPLGKPCSAAVIAAFRSVRGLEKEVLSWAEVERGSDWERVLLAVEDTGDGVSVTWDDGVRERFASALYLKPPADELSYKSEKHSLGIDWLGRITPYPEGDMQEIVEAMESPEFKGIFVSGLTGAGMSELCLAQVIEGLDIGEELTSREAGAASLQWVMNSITNHMSYKRHWLYRQQFTPHEGRGTLAKVPLSQLTVLGAVPIVWNTGDIGNQIHLPGGFVEPSDPNTPYTLLRTNSLIPEGFGTFVIPDFGVVEGYLRRNLGGIAQLELPRLNVLTSNDGEAIRQTLQPGDVLHRLGPYGEREEDVIASFRTLPFSPRRAAGFKWSKALLSIVADPIILLLRGTYWAMDAMASVVVKILRYLIT